MAHMARIYKTPLAVLAKRMHKKRAKDAIFARHGLCLRCGELVKPGLSRLGGPYLHCSRCLWLSRDAAADPSAGTRGMGMR